MKTTELIYSVKRIQKFTQKMDEMSMHSLSQSKESQLGMISSYFGGSESYSRSELMDNIFSIISTIRSIEYEDDSKPNNLLKILKDSLISILELPTLTSEAFYEEVFLVAIDEMFNNSYKDVLDGINSFFVKNKDEKINDTDYWLELLTYVDNYELIRFLERVQGNINYYNNNINKLPDYFDKFDNIFKEYEEKFSTLKHVLYDLELEIIEYLEKEKPDTSKLEVICKQG